MHLNEYQTKQLFARYGITVPKGRVASSSSEVRQITEELGGQVVIKAQVLVHGRGKLGGIRIARSTQDAELIAIQILGKSLQGIPVHKVLVDELVSFEQQYYVAIITDRKDGLPVLIASAVVGAGRSHYLSGEVEQTITTVIDPLFGLSDFQIRDAALHIDLETVYWKQFHDILKGLWQVYWESDANLAEINPLVVTKSQGLVTLDGEVDLDDEALFRHLELAEMRDLITNDPIMIEARKYGFTYLKLDGNIGTLCNGTGLALASIDRIHQAGGFPACILDIGVCYTPGKAEIALRLLLEDPTIDMILINIFAGLSDDEQIALGFRNALIANPRDIPIYARIKGVYTNIANTILEKMNVHCFDSFEDAVESALLTPSEVTV
ncbi:MAG: acetate--CoA ligase family protein [Anaerolineaceae bacterium]|nr:acetate--CoA ligase family protein [Anaerolineaceae bacterium]